MTVGRVTGVLDLSMPSGIGPSFQTELSRIVYCDRANDLPASTYVYSQTGLQAKLSNVAYQYGASLNKVVVMLNGRSFAGTGVTAGSVADSEKWSSKDRIYEKGEVPVTVTLTDSRGNTYTTSHTISVQDYSLPSATIAAERCDAQGNQDPVSVYMRYTLKWTSSTVKGFTNTCTPWLGYKLTKASAYTELTSAKGQNVSLIMAETEDGTVALEVDQSYIVQVVLTDCFNMAAFSDTVPMCQYVQAVDASRNSTGLYTVPHQSKSVVVDEEHDFWAYGHKLADAIYPVGSTFIGKAPPPIPEDGWVETETEVWTRIAPEYTASMEVIDGNLYFTTNTSDIYPYIKDGKLYVDWNGEADLTDSAVYIERPEGVPDSADDALGNLVIITQTREETPEREPLMLDDNQSTEKAVILSDSGKTAWNDYVRGTFLGHDGTIHLANTSNPAVSFWHSDDEGYRTILTSTKGLTATRTITLPGKTGTVALTSDIPDTPSNATTSAAGLMSAADKTILSRLGTRIHSSDLVTGSGLVKNGTNSSGTQLYGLPTATACDVCKITLTAGDWIIYGGICFDSSSASGGIVRATIYTTSQTTSSSPRYSTSQQNTSAYDVTLTTMMTAIGLTSSTVVYLIGYQTSGSTITCNSAYLCAVCVG